MEGRVLFSTVGTGAMQPRDIESFDFGVAPCLSMMKRKKTTIASWD